MKKHMTKPDILVDVPFGAGEVNSGSKDKLLQKIRTSNGSDFL
jgi:hypothetical protein